MSQDVDRYFDNHPSGFEMLRTQWALRFALRGCKMRPEEPIHWTPTQSPLVEGLNLLEMSDDAAAPGVDADSDLVVSTVRMGFGHHRIALGVGSYGAKYGKNAQLLDLLASDRDESHAIRRLDEFYSMMSRVSAEMGGPLEAFWGRLMQSGGVGSARMAHMLTAELGALLSDLPRDVPFISAYPLNGHLAVRLGFRRVVNLIFDNDPQHFLIVPGALNLVQTTSSYEKLRLLGVPRNEVALGGHWVARDLVENVPADSAARIARAESGTPRRFMLAIGGAGAQKTFVTALVEALRDALMGGQTRLLINLGDHEHLRAPFMQLLEHMKIDYDRVHGYEALSTFCQARPLEENDDTGLKAVTLFTFDQHLEAVRATDRLMRVSDVLVTKPSELAFVPVPKLHIRRVGDHEAASARRSAELGDGTLECREVEEAVRMVNMMSDSSEFLVPMNERIIANTEKGVYDGAARAVEYALDGSHGLASDVRLSSRPAQAGAA